MTGVMLPALWGSLPVARCIVPGGPASPVSNTGCWGAAGRSEESGGGVRGGRRPRGVAESCDLLLVMSGARLEVSASTSTADEN